MKSSMSRQFTLALMLACASLPGNESARAATWAGPLTPASTTPWNVDTNWTLPATFPNGIDAAALITNNISANQVIELNQTITVGSLTVGDASNGFTINTGSGGSGLVFETSGGNAILSSGAGSATAANMNFINANIAFNSNTEIKTTTNRNLTLSGALTGSSSLIFNGAGSDIVLINGDISSFTGTFDFPQVTGANALTFNGTTANSLDGSQAKFLLSGTSTNRFLRFGSTTPASTSTFKMGELNGGSGTRIAADNAATSTVTLEVGALGTDSSFAGLITELTTTGLALRKVGAGSLTLSNTGNLYELGTTVSAGTLIAAGNAAPAPGIFVSGGVFGAPLVANQVIQLNDGATGANAVNLLTGGAFTISLPINVNDQGTGVTGIGGLSTSSSTFSGAITLNKSVTFAQNTLGGTLQVTGDLAGAGANAKTITFGSANTVPVIAPSGFFGAVNVATVISDGSGGGTVSVSIAGGTATFVGPNTYTGATNVNAGTLLVNGSLAAASAVNVAGGATLGGDGDINGSVAMSALSILAPGTSPGSLETGVLSLADSTALNWELDAPNLGNSTLSDRVDVVGALTLDGVLNVTAVGGFGTPVAGDRWRLFNYTGAFADNGVAFGTLPSLGGGLFYTVDTSVANQVDLLISVVPEPGSALLAMIGLVGISSMSRRRRK